MQATNVAPAPQTILGALRPNWGWLLVLGIVLLLLGMIGLGMTFGLTIISVLYFGILLLIGGGAQLVESFGEKSWRSWGLHVLVALLYLLSGALVIYDPVLASVALTLVIAASFLCVGTVRAMMAFQMKPGKGWWLVLLGGIVSIALGAMILAKWPASGLWVLGLFLAVELIVQGWSLIMIALAARSGAFGEKTAQVAA